MSNPDSFINEISEEVRRDRLYALLRRWGWVAALIVIGIVGGAAWTEWSRANRAEKAQAFGDSVMAALTAEDVAARRAALAGIEPADANQVAILGLLQASAALDGDDADAQAARDRLLAVADTPDLATTYRHLALIKAMLAGGSGDAARDGAILEELAAPGAPFRSMAIELQALTALDAGDEETALTLLRALTEDAEATQALRRRAQQLIVALGALPEPA
jgi:hypothetical protein|tara:strand:- start:1080 stop:1739 length:660 start_codon:yes stop_codon:yes gene_type:complete